MAAERVDLTENEEEEEIKIVLNREEEQQEQEVILAAKILVRLSDKAWTDESVGVEECEGAMAGRGGGVFFLQQ